MKKIILVLTASVLLSHHAFSQIKQRADASFPTPNAANLGLYVDLPISRFTGMPNIEIPIYEIVEGSFKMPITLNYHPGSVRVHSHPGWVGLGWSLIAGGSISRVENGFMDEMTIKWNGEAVGFYGNYSKLSGSETEWCSPSRLQQYATEYYPHGNSYVHEAMPDEFNFSFLGYSGKFFMEHDGQWKVVSDQPIKIEFDATPGEGFIAESGLRSNILNRINAFLGDKTLWSNRFFNKFTLITPDGVRFEFGGINATEYTVLYSYQWESSGFPRPNSWNLSKVTLPTGQIISLNYVPGEMITSMSKPFSKISVSGTNCEFQTAAPQDYDGAIMFPVYLSSINYSTGSVNFERSVSTELRWPSDSEIDGDIGSPPGANGILPVYFEPVPSAAQGYGLQRKWYKLNSIKINSLIHSTTDVKQFDFTYTSSATTRLKLLSLQEHRPHALSIPPYVFTYNPRELPSYAENKSNDHWDFFNGLDPLNFSTGTFSNNFQAFYKCREPDLTGEFMKAELLEQIQYPTGGSVKFEYEPHTYSKVVNRENPAFPIITLDPSLKTGGLRIKRILHFNNLTDASPSLIKDYFYVKDYFASSDPGNLPSSGILGGYPKYYWANYQANDVDGDPFTYSIFHSGSLLPFGYNIPGNHIGYSEVVEVSKTNTESTNGYSIYKYSNFDQDIWGEQHSDAVGISIDPARSVYSPISTRDMERGKLLSEEYYTTSGGQPIRRIRYRYSPSSSGYIRRLEQDHLNVCSHVSAGSQTVFVTAYKTHAYSCNLTLKEVTEFDGANSFTTTTNYNYNAQNLLSSTSANTSDGSTVESIIRYPLDFTTNENITGSDVQAIGLSKLVKKYMINMPIETISKRNSLVTGANVMSFEVFANNVFPKQQWTLERVSPLQTGVTIGNGVGGDIDKFNPSGLFQTAGNYFFGKDEHYTQHPVVFNRYDSYGNLLEVYNSENIVTCYVWSYLNSRPVMEIAGANYTQLTNAAGAASINLNAFGASVPISADLLTKISSLRNYLPGAQITGYTYNHFGIKSKIDPNGRATEYEYDYLGRLVWIKDHTGKITQAINYHYSGEN